MQDTANQLSIIKSRPAEQLIERSCRPHPMLFLNTRPNPPPFLAEDEVAPLGGMFFSSNR